MRRRGFLGLIGGALWVPFVARAQGPGHTYRIGFLIPARRQTPPVAAFFDELRANGFVEGQNLLVISGGFEATDDNLTDRAKTLVEANLDAIVAGPEGPLRAIRNLTDKVPLVGVVEDMVGAGLVTSFAHPGGNITGISLLSPELDGKRQDILIEAVPAARRIAVMADAAATPPSHIQELQNAGKSRGIEILVFGVSAPDQISSAINSAKAAGAEALNFLATPLFSIPGTHNNRVVMERVNGWLWSVSMRYGCHQFFSGPKQQKKQARLSHTVPALSIFIVNAHKLLRRYFGEKSLLKFQYNSLVGLNSSLI
jgi:putative tryptophan/tyrosine transport system substrate-binding protein